MTSGLRFRLARPEDARAIGVLARRVVRRWVLPGQPAEAAAPLLAGMTAKALLAKMRDGQRFYLAYADGALAGVAAVRNDSHVFQLFVGTRYQGRGVGRQLWERLRRDCVRRAGTRVFTLNAAPGAVSVYLRFGFQRDPSAHAPARKLVTTPMTYREKAPRRGRAASGKRNQAPARLAGSA